MIIDCSGNVRVSIQLLEHLNKNLNKDLDVIALLEDKREGQGAEESGLDAKINNMDLVIEELRVQNKRFLEKEKERQRKAEERRKQQRDAEAVAVNEKKKPFLRRIFG